MNSEPHSPVYFRRKRPYGIEVADAEDVTYSETNLGIEGVIVAVGQFCFDEFAQVQPSYTGDEIEEDALTIPFRVQGDILIRHHLPAMQESEAVGIVGVTLIGIRLP